VAILDEGVNLAGQQINPGQQADCAIALVFMIAREGRVPAGLRLAGSRRHSQRTSRKRAPLLWSWSSKFPIASTTGCGLMLKLLR
jgi:hypothetical protein